MESKSNKDLLMPKGWKCLNCGSYQFKELSNLNPSGKWTVQGECKDCQVLMRFTKHGSYIYAYPKKEQEKIPF